MGRELHVEVANQSVFSLVGVLTISYFLHTGALSILRNAQHPENNIRDLRIAYGLGCVTYLAVGVGVYVTFQGDKNAIKQNFLNNFNVMSDSYIYAILAQCFLLLQFFTVVPLLAFVIRFQTLTMVFDGDPWPRSVLLCVCVCVCVCVRVCDSGG